MRKLQELFVSYEIAAKLKEKGFEVDCLAMYSERYNNGKLSVIGQHEGSSVSGDCNINFEGMNYNVTVAPLTCQVTEWLEEKHGFFFERLYNELEKEGFIVWRNKTTINLEQYDTINQSITEALKLI